MKKLSVHEFEQSDPRLFLAPPGGAADLRGGARRVVCGFGSVSRSAHPPSAAGAFYAPDFSLRDPAPWRVPERFETVEVQIDDGAEAAAFVHPFEPLRADAVGGEVAAITDLIRRSGWQKVVPVWFSSAPKSFSAEHRASLLRSALRAAPEHAPYGLLDPVDGLIGVTPEVLFRVHPDGRIETMALAGTQRRTGGGGPADLLNDAKERTEHRIVVDFIVEALEPLGAVSVGAIGVVEFPALRHLHTPISVRPNRAPEFIDLVRRLHPTPALGAAPRREGLAWLTAREARVPRGRHGAPFGVVMPSGEMICLVAIRNVQWDERGAHIGAGCGIVAGSTPEGEYAEASAKVESVCSMLGIRR